MGKAEREREYKVRDEGRESERKVKTDREEKGR